MNATNHQTIYIDMRSTPAVEEGPRLLPKAFILLGGLVFLLWIAPPVVPLLYLGLAVYALKGPKEAIQALTLLALLLLLNPGIFSNLSSGSSLRWLVLFAAFGRMVWDSVFQEASTPQDVLRPLFLFSFVAFVLALLVSFMPSISILKVVSFTVGTSTILTGFYRTAHLQTYWSSWFLTFFLLILVASLPLYGSSLGYFRNGVGFQGILNHPQVYGPVAAPMAVWLTGLVLFRSNRSLPVLGGALLGWFAIYTSLSRTSFVMAVGGLGLAIVVGILWKPYWRSVISRTLAGLSVLIMLFLWGGLALLQGPRLMKIATDFLLKDNKEVSYEESFQGSRGFLIEEQIENFRAAPFTGIGFGVPSTSERLRVKTGGLLGLPTGASVEKGFMPSAVLEETGVIGGLLVVFLLLALIRPVYQRGSISLFAMLLACLLVNVGEMVFFSVGGMGLYFWLLIGMCYNLTAAAPICHRATDRASYAPARFVRT